MHKFQCKARSGKIEPIEPKQKSLMQNLLHYYEQDEDKTFSVILMETEKDISKEQQGVYRAFVYKASVHFGNTYPEMERLLEHFKPYDMEYTNKKSVSKWTTRELNSFIQTADSFLKEYGFNFK